MFCGLEYSLGMGQQPGILVVHTKIAAENVHCPTQIVSQVAWPVSFLVQSSSFVVWGLVKTLVPSEPQNSW
jgi:hypothetical protein